MAKDLTEDRQKMFSLYDRACEIVPRLYEFSGLEKGGLAPG
jgi:hypothetical protein